MITPKRGGTLETCRDSKGRRYFRGKVRLADGTLARITIDEPKRYSETASRDFVAWAQEEEDTHHTIYDAKVARLASETAPAASGETADEWFERYVAVHAALGCRVTQHRGDWRRYVHPFFGAMQMVDVTPDAIKAARDNLTRARLAGEIKAKRALNLWSDIIKAPFSRAFTDDDPKYSAVRVGPAKQNPTLGIKPPASLADKEEDERERQALEPGEALALLSCADVPLDERRFYAIATYTGLRPAELYGLTWADVRLDAARPVVKVQRGRDMKSGEDGAGKTRQAIRDVPLHPNLRPLLRAMGTGALASARVFPVERVRDVEAKVLQLREHLKRAGIDRPELHDGTPQLLPFDVRSLRTTFATWCAKAGYDSSWVDVWLGHKPKTTAAKHYVKDTPAFEDVALKPVAAGVVPAFPELPEALISTDDGPPAVHRPAKWPKLRCEGRDLNPYRSYPTGT